MTLLEAEAPLRNLTSDEVAAFDRDGVICIRGLFSKRWITCGREAISSVIAQMPPKDRFDLPHADFRNDAMNWHRIDKIRDFALFGPGAHIVRQALQSQTLNFFGDQIFVKNAPSALRAPWHHDMTFLPLEGMQCASVWATFDPVSQTQSALEFVAGSHQWARRFEPVGVGGVVKSLERLEAVPDIESQRDNFEILGWDLEPGDALVFHALTLHSSKGNSASAQRRRALTTRWCGDDITFKDTGSEMRIAWHHGLSHGDRLKGPVFPRVLPQIDLASIAPRMADAIAPDPLLADKLKQQQTLFKRVPGI